VASLTRRFHVLSAIRSSPYRIELADARALLAGGALLVDVQRQDDREPLAGALRIAPDELPGEVAAFPRDVPVVLACG
jgi:hypothetical protein